MLFIPKIYNTHVNENGHSGAHCDKILHLSASQSVDILSNRDCALSEKTAFRKWSSLLPNVGIPFFFFIKLEQNLSIAWSVDFIVDWAKQHLKCGSIHVTILKKLARVQSYTIHWSWEIRKWLKAGFLTLKKLIVFSFNACPHLLDMDWQIWRVQLLLYSRNSLLWLSDNRLPCLIMNNFREGWIILLVDCKAPLESL